jgi:predicted enzyme related to lactoylglutathione lyase
MASAVNWFDIPAADIERATRFYSAIFDTPFEVRPERHRLRAGRSRRGGGSRQLPFRVVGRTSAVATKGPGRATDAGSGALH